MCRGHVRCRTSVTPPPCTTKPCWPRISIAFAVATLGTWNARWNTLLPSQVIKSARLTWKLIRMGCIDRAVMTTGARIIDKSDSPSQAVVARWARLAFSLSALIIVCSYGTVCRYIRALSTESSRRTNVTNASVLTKEGGIGTWTVGQIVAVDVGLPNWDTYNVWREDGD